MNNNLYDYAIIGGGISSCVFASSHIKNDFNGRIAIIENGRSLGGRSSTRNSLKNSGWQLNHGSPNFNICNINKDHLLKSFIHELLDSKIIESDPSDFIELHKNPSLDSKINSDFYKGANYTSKFSMSEFSKAIISFNNLRNQVDYYFETLIVRLDYKNKVWVLTSKEGTKFKTKFLVCSSNLILHKRSLDIMKIKQIPLRRAIPLNKDKKIDEIINHLDQQDYIQRLTFLIYTKPGYCFKDKYKNRFRYFHLNNFLEKKFKLERIIFQRQINNKLGIVIHTKNKEFIKEYFQSKNKERFNEKLLDNFNKVFDRNKYINKIMNFQEISTMIWRASQPSGLAVPEYLQVCENYNIGFCGDWFDLEGFGRIEGAILSALKLSYKINSIF